MSIVKVGNQVLMYDNQLVSVTATGPAQGTYKIGPGGLTPSVPAGGTKAPILFPNTDSVIWPGDFSTNPDLYGYTIGKLTDLNGALGTTGASIMPGGTGLRDLAITLEAGEETAAEIMFIKTDVNSKGLVTKHTLGGDEIWTSEEFGSGSGYTGNAMNITYDANLDVAFIGGTFATYGGVNARRLVAINGTDGSTYAAFDTTAGFTTSSGTVYKTILDGNGGLIVLGSRLSAYNGSAIPNNIVRLLLADGTVDASFNEGGAGTASATDLVIDGFIDAAGEYLYVISNTVSYNGTSVYGVFRISLNSETFGQLDENWIPTIEGLTSLYVSSISTIFPSPLEEDVIIATSGSSIYRLTLLGEYGYLWDTWSGPTDNFKNSTIYSMALNPNPNDSKLYVAGTFSTIDDNYFINSHARFIIDATNNTLTNDTSNEKPTNWE